MVDHTDRAMTAFLDVWLPEFKKSVEMFTGQPITLERAGRAEAGTTIGSGELALWQGQTFERDRGGVAWVGTALETCIALTKTLAEDSAACESFYLELLEQSFEGAAQLLSSGQQQKIVRGQTVKNQAPPLDLAYETVWLGLSGRERAPILVGIESALVAILLEGDQKASKAPGGAQKADHRLPQSVERLADLELPVAVVLGRAKVRVGEALKLTAGSLIELDRRVGESVEIIVHNVVVARGEVVSVKGNYGVRIKEVTSQRERYALQASASSSSLTRLQLAVSGPINASVAG